MSDLLETDALFFKYLNSSSPIFYDIVKSVLSHTFLQPHLQSIIHTSEILEFWTPFRTTFS